jgi:2-oxoglutarate dehydrogenase complex dehydrogenase (E1) component-like enzyme
VEKVLFCSGKIYYELVNERKSRGMEDTVAIVRTEQVCSNTRSVDEALQNWRGGGVKINSI